MKKTLLALAVTALSANAFAVDLNAANSDAINFASEIKLPAVLTDTAANNLDVKVQLGFSATAGVKRYVRFDLTNAQFETPVIAGDLTEGGAVALADSIAVGGTKGSTSVVIEITPATTLANNAVLTLALANIKATGADASIQYRLYETGVDANAGNNSTLAAKSGKLFGFKSALNAKVTVKGAEQKIDVTQESKFFVDVAKGDVTNVVGKLTVGVNPAVYSAAGATVALTDLVDSAKVEVAGDFTAGLKDADGKLLATAAVLTGATASEVTAAKATYTVDPATGLVDAPLTLTVDGKTALATQTFTAKLVPVAKAAYTVNSVDLGVLGELQKNGSSESLNLALKPGGVYQNYVRISNTSNLDGKFFITVITDEGKTATVNLSDVAGQPATLAARASTTQMTIQQIFDAATAKGLALSGEGKLRLVVEGEVPSLSAQMYTTSKDGNSFDRF
ncbi:MAG: hypothetical protein CMK99_01655 [Pseudomonas sp.]|nr:hypothetical protein [Pseudomonas sp.]HBS78863.1 hypothetical protein [Pseudomonas sp.]|tara:strand:- start:9927 stop:11279 length:1353 start_codon:yes stop_codon:yes gene_type:complete